MQFSTGGVIDLLGVAPHRVDYLIRDRKIRLRKGPTGAFVWTRNDVERASVRCPRLSNS
jgi:hypothetical protein